MLPTAGPGGTVLSALSRAGSPVAYTTSTVKGLEYASFSALDGAYTATYSAPAGGAMALSALAVDPGTATADQSATMTWTSSAVADTEVALGTSPSALNTKVKVGDATRKHELVTRQLKPGTTYYYRVTSTDLKGRSETYPATGQAPASFTTPAKDTKAPNISSVRVTPLPGGVATVRWTTSEPSTAVAQVGTSNATLATAAVDGELSSAHALVLTGLDPGRTYLVKGLSSDAAGNQGRSGPVRFVSPAWGVSEQSAPSFKRGVLSGDATIDDQDPLGRITLKGGTGARSGTFVSGLLDAQAMVEWDRAVLDTTVPRGASLSVQVRTGSTSTPDATWTDWTTVPASARVTGASRYLQYRVQLSAAAGEDAPSLSAVGFSHNGGAPATEGEVP
jgi:hypothetical protein